MYAARIKWAAIAVSVITHGALGFAASHSQRPQKSHGFVAVEIRKPEPPAPVAAPPPVTPRPEPPRPRVAPPRRPRPATPVPPPPLAPPPPARPERAPPPTPAPASGAPVASNTAGEGVPVAAAPAVPSAKASGVRGPVTASSGGPAASPAHHGPSFGDLSGYLGDVQGRVGRHRRYPEMAVRLGLEGVVEVRVRVRSDGSLVGAPSIATSSGHDLLDQEALRMVAKAAPFPPPPGTSGGPAELTVPVRFHLEE